MGVGEDIQRPVNEDFRVHDVHKWQVLFREARKGVSLGQERKDMESGSEGW